MRLSKELEASENYDGRRRGVESVGATRVIYYFHNELMPLFALDIYAKNEKDDLSADEKRAWKTAVANLVKSYRRA